MDLKTIRAELRQLSALVEGWAQTDAVPALERDLALGKLRSVYDKVRFGEAESVEETPAEEDATGVAEVIDLGDVLSLDPFAGPEELVTEPAEPAAEEAVPESEPEPVAESEPELVAESELVAELESVAESEPAAEPAPAADSTPTESAAPAAFAEPTVAPAVAAPVAEPVVEPAPAVAAEPEPVAEPEKTHHYTAPTLFGMEEETVRHRNKQRVIMSLYDTVVETPARPEPAPKSAPVPAETAAPVSAEVAASVFAAVAASASEETPAPGPADVSALSFAETPAPAPADVSTSSLAETPVPAPADVSVPSHAESQAPGPAEVVVPEAPTGEPAAVPEVPAETPGFRDSVPVTEPEPEEEDEGGFEEITLNPSAPAGTVLGDVINHDVQTLADTIAPPRDRASELRRSEPVTDLRKAIGINDKFLLIRDLFGGDGDAYEKAIGMLNDCADFDDCMIYIAENYAWNPNSDGVKLLMDLLERKFA